MFGILSTYGIAAALIAIIAGILVLIKPRIIASIVGIYLIITGLLFIFAGITTDITGYALSDLIAGIITVVVGIILLIWPRIITGIMGIYLTITGIAAVLGRGIAVPDDFSVSGITAGIISIIVGTIILVRPRILTTIMGFYLVVTGIITLIASL